MAPEGLLGHGPDPRENATLLALESLVMIRHWLLLASLLLPPSGALLLWLASFLNPRLLSQDALVPVYVGVIVANALALAGSMLFYGATAGSNRSRVCLVINGIGMVANGV